MQKSEFLKALSDMWKDFDSRVLRYKVCFSAFFCVMLHCDIFFGPDFQELYALLCSKQLDEVILYLKM